MTTRRPIPIILDTDIGTDPDDLLALLMIASSPELELLAITTTYGDTNLRAAIASQTCRWIGIDPMVAAGPATTMTEREIWYAGNEQGQLGGSRGLRPAEYPDAVDTILELSSRDEMISIIAIGPLTNLAHAVRRDPSLPLRVGTLAIMGGDFADSNAAEHNLVCDSKAARIVFEAGFNTRVIGVEQTRRLPLPKPATRQWTDGVATPIRTRLASDLDWWRAYNETDEILVHDPLAVALVTDPDRFSVSARAVTVATDPDHTGCIVDSDGTTVDVVTDFDVSGLERIIVDRIGSTVDASPTTQQGPA